MPDFERLIDKLRVDLARTPEERAFAEGFNAGKRRARKELACIAAFLAIIAASLATWVAV